MNQNYTFLYKKATFSFSYLSTHPKVTDLQNFVRGIGMANDMPPIQDQSFPFLVLQVGFNRALKSAVRLASEDPHCRLVQSFLDLE